MSTDGAFAELFVRSSPAQHTGAKRKKPVEEETWRPVKTRYANDTERIQRTIDALPSLCAPAPTERCTPVQYRRALTHILQGESARWLKGVREANELRTRFEECLTPCFCGAEPHEAGPYAFLPCGHAFHLGCIHSWAQEDYEGHRKADREEERFTCYRPRCPQCRSNIL
jgi:hypothetical protein